MSLGIGMWSLNNHHNLQPRGICSVATWSKVAFFGGLRFPASLPECLLIPGSREAQLDYLLEELPRIDRTAIVH